MVSFDAQYLLIFMNMICNSMGITNCQRQKNMERIEVEGDARSCFDAIKESCSIATWLIQSNILIYDVVYFSKFFISCKFVILTRLVESLTLQLIV